MAGHPVRLTMEEFLEAASVGLLRYAYNRAAGNSHKPPLPGPADWVNALATDVVGACGERVVARYHQAYWSPLRRTEDRHTLPDVANLEVRATVLDTGRLIVRPDDPAGRLYALVTGRPPLMTYRGWIPRADAERLGSWEDPDGRGYAWWVRPEDLIGPP